MVHATCLFCLVSTAIGCCKNAPGRGNASIGHITKLEQFTVLRYLWVQPKWRIHTRKLHIITLESNLL
jgi:hypothetical protein